MSPNAARSCDGRDREPHDRRGEDAGAVVPVSDEIGRRHLVQIVVSVEVVVLHQDREPDDRTGDRSSEAPSAGPHQDQRGGSGPGDQDDVRDSVVVEVPGLDRRVAGRDSDGDRREHEAAGPVVEADDEARERLEAHDVLAAVAVEVGQRQREHVLGGRVARTRNERPSGGLADDDGRGTGGRPPNEIEVPVLIEIHEEPVGRGHARVRARRAGRRNLARGEQPLSGRELGRGGDDDHTAGVEHVHSLQGGQCADRIPLPPKTGAGSVRRPPNHAGVRGNPKSSLDHEPIVRYRPLLRSSPNGPAVGRVRSAARPARQRDSGPQGGET